MTAIEKPASSSEIVTLFEKWLLGNRHDAPMLIRKVLSCKNWQKGAVVLLINHKLVNIK